MILQMFYTFYNPDKKFGTEYINPVKLDRIRKV